MTLVEFLLARIAEDEQDASARDREAMRWSNAEWEDYGSKRAHAECESKRRIVEWHKSWPVLVETPPTFDPALSDDLSSATIRMSKQIMWATEQEYRNRFGSEPPTGPVLRLLALPYADHPDYREEWAPMN